jgi:hypothetical protein
MGTDEVVVWATANAAMFAALAAAKRSTGAGMGACALTRLGSTAGHSMPRRAKEAATKSIKPSIRAPDMARGDGVNPVSTNV